MKKTLTVLFAIATVGMQFGIVHPASAQRLTVGGSNSNFGSVRLSPGFTPDPHQVTITSGGRLDVSDMNLGGGCVGFATAQPDYILHLSSNTNFLRFYNEGNGDTGLVINDPGGKWYCDDDSHTGTNPMVSIEDARDGQYDIWVTSYSSDDNISGTLHITELRTNPGGSSKSGDRLSVGGSESNYGSATLSPGFTPDPHQVTITSGGRLDVGGMDLGSGCVGYATRQPDYILHMSQSTDFLRFYVEGNGDTGLVINDPSGDWQCDDDSHTGTNPMVSINNAASGQYDIWVTSYSSDENIQSTLHITELHSNPGDDGDAGGSLTVGSSAANYGAVTLSPGFTPDPHEVTVTSGGTLNVAAMNLGSGCVGYATAQPDYILNLTSLSSRLRIYNTGDGDTGLVVNDPAGNWYCNDDSYGGTDPTVTIDSARKGHYDIWVTSYSRDDRIRGTLHITELDSRHPTTR